MSLLSRCPYCEKLPALGNRTAGRPAKCPLCKGELIVAWGSGDTYRPATAEEVAAGRRRRGRTLAVAGAAVVVLGCAVVTAVLVNRTGGPRPHHGALAQAPSA